MNSILEFMNGNDALRAFGLSLLHSLWQGALIAALLWLVLKLNGHVSAKARYGFALIAGGLLLACFAFSFSYNLGSSGAGFMQAKAHPYVVVTPGQTSGMAIEQNVVQQLGAQWNHVKSWTRAHVGYFLLAWFAGFLLYASRLVFGMLYLGGIKRQSNSITPYWAHKVKALQQKLGFNAKVSLLSSDKVSTPLTFGWLKPVIVVPVSMLTLLPTDQVESILLHELAHIRRHDYLVNLLQSIAELFFFFNPGYRYITHVLETEREHVCDDLVVRHTANHRTYALALANLAQLPSEGDSRLALAAAGKKGSLLMRIKRIMHTSTSTTMTHNTNNRKGYQVTALLIACFLFAFMAVNVNGNHIKPQENENAPAAVMDNITVTGVVLAPNGKVLPGVSVMVKRGTTGTATGADGRYSLSALPTDTLVYRFIGFESLQLAATDKATQRVVLKQAGMAKAGQAVEAIQVEGKPHNGQAVTVKGVQQVDAGAITVTGRTSESAARTITVAGRASENTAQTLSIKGASKEAGKQPVYYIYEGDALKGLTSGTAAFARAAANGKQVTDLKDIKPEFIQSVHVLKDKVAVSTFGEAAENGAVLISLKENAYLTKTFENTEELIVYPVPADRIVKLKFYLNRKQHVKADAIDLYGTQVKGFTNQVLERGWHEFEWDASKSPAGTYIIVLHKENGVENKRVLLK